MLRPVSWQPGAGGAGIVVLALYGSAGGGGGGDYSSRQAVRRSGGFPGADGKKEAGGRQQDAVGRFLPECGLCTEGGRAVCGGGAGIQYNNLFPYTVSVRPVYICVYISIMSVLPEGEGSWHSFYVIYNVSIS